MENEILEILKRLENKIDNIESKIDNIKEDLGVIEKVIKTNCYDIAKLRAKNYKIDELESEVSKLDLITANNYKTLVEIKARNFKTDNTIKNENTETLEVIKYKIQRLDDDVIGIKNKIYKKIE